MNNLYISQVPPPMVRLCWDGIKDQLKRALDKSAGFISLDDIKAAAEAGKLFFVVVIDGQEVIAVAACERVSFMNHVTLRVQLLAGDDMDRWIEPLLEHAESLGRSLGAKIIEAPGRPGWQRTMVDHGFQSKSTVIYKTLENDNA